MSFALKVKTNEGQQVLKCLSAESTIRDLKSQLSVIGNIPVERLHVLVGFPPKVFDLSIDAKALKEAGLASGDTLILQEKAAAAAAVVSPVKVKEQEQEQASRQQEVYAHITDENFASPGILLKYVVPADNSCLFSSIYFVLNGHVDTNGADVRALRQIAAKCIADDKDTYTEAILGKPNENYCDWIRNEKSWGGAIEIAALSQYYNTEIVVVDIINGIINRFGEDQKYPSRVLLLFDGIHYDPLYLEPISGGHMQTKFSVENVQILREAEQLAKEAQSSRQFTDVNKFTLKCLVCSVLMKGQTEAQQHAISTGHHNFGEV